jgi:hypothetical protein
MHWQRLLFITVMIVSLAGPARAGLFFNRKPKPAPPERVPALLVALKTDKEERRRADAATQLREFDSTAYPEIVPALVETAQNDPKTGVRLEAIQSLAKIRPISQQAGMALEYVTDHDSSWRVRLQARSLLLQYRLSGYRSAKQDDASPRKRGDVTGEPPLAPDVAEPAIGSVTQPTTNGPTKIIVNSSSPLVPVPAPKLDRAPRKPGEPPPAGPDLSPPG